MKKITTAFLILASVLGILLFSSHAEATLITDLNYSNVNLGLTGTFATVSVDVTGNIATFTVDANQALLGAGTNFGIQAFGFNTNLTLASTDFSLPASNWGVKFNQNLSMFGNFYIDLAGKGNSRQDPLIFTVTNAGINNENQFYIANSDGYHYAAHIADFTNGRDDDSAWFSDKATSPVPEPATLMLLGSGLLGLAGFRRKIKK
jgi:hypothetical protein